MFDPTVFDNLKVAFENGLYDLDNLDRAIDITDRKDTLDMAVMSRQFAVSFRLAGEEAVTAQFVLDYSLRDLAAEILEQQGETPACGLRLRFFMNVSGEAECEDIERRIVDIWQPERKPVQTLSRIYGSGQAHYSNSVELHFHRRIHEDQMEDIPELLEHAIRTMESLCERRLC